MIAPGRNRRNSAFRVSQSPIQYLHPKDRQKAPVLQDSEAVIGVLGAV
jgi:hypothetical protein